MSGEGAGAGAGQWWGREGRGERGGEESQGAEMGRSVGCPGHVFTPTWDPWPVGLECLGLEVLGPYARVHLTVFWEPPGTRGLNSGLMQDPDHWAPFLAPDPSS